MTTSKKPRREGWELRSLLNPRVGFRGLRSNKSVSLCVVVRRQATTARGGHRWLWMVEEEVWGVGWGFREEKGRQTCVFMLLDIFVTCKTHRGEILLALSKLAQLRLIWASSRRVPAPTYFTAFVQRSYLTIQMLFWKFQRLKHEEVGCEPTIHIWRRSNG